MILVPQLILCNIFANDINILAECVNLLANNINMLADIV